MSPFSLDRFPEDVQRAQDVIADIVHQTPLEINEILSKQYQANIYLKREDTQPVRSYKIR